MSSKPLPYLKADAIKRLNYKSAQPISDRLQRRDEAAESTVNPQVKIPTTNMQSTHVESTTQGPHAPVVHTAYDDFGG